MNVRNIFLIISLISTLYANGIEGPLLDTSEIPHSLCKIRPIDPAPFDSPTNVCSGIIIGKNHILTASHCVFLPYNVGRIDCFGGDTDKRFLRSQVHLKNPEVKIHPQGRYNAEELREDLAIIVTEEELISEPATLPTTPIDFETVKDLVSLSQCKYAGVGWNNHGLFGLAHAARTPPTGLQDNPKTVFLIKGEPHVRGHDSGGGFFCKINDVELLIGTLTGQKGKGSLVSPIADKETLDWISGILN